jgi:hypothetical protein
MRSSVHLPQARARHLTRPVFNLAVRLMVMAFLVWGCSASARSPSFTYRLETGPRSDDAAMPQKVEIGDGALSFVFVFDGGGGSYDKAELQSGDHTLRVALSDIDGKLENMLVRYSLEGTISGIQPGNYRFTVEGKGDVLFAREISLP